MSGRERKPLNASAEPLVGIFWLVRGELLFDTTPLSRAEQYGDFKIHGGDHVSVWERFRSANTVPQEMEYEESPRGRVMFNSTLGNFTLFADRCILRRKAIVAKIRKQLHLPKNTIESTDSHYRCFSCLHRSSAD